MFNRTSLIDAFKRILEIADRDHLYLPFKRDSKLRAKYFPGAGSQIGRKKLTEAYAREFAEATSDEKLLQHATWPWIHGYDASLAQILDDLKKYCDDTPGELPTNKKSILERKFTRVGAEEIAAFWTVYAAADKGYRKGVIDMLVDVKPPEITPPIVRPSQPPAEQNSEAPTQLEPGSQSAYALFGSLIFTVPTLILVGVQYWRLPEESHWIVVSIAAIFGLITLIFLIDFLRKRNE